MRGRRAPRSRRAGQAEGFGRALAFDGQTAIVGAEGSAHVFRRTAPGVWQVVSVLTGNDEGGGGDFGVSVAVDGDQAIVGALGTQPSNGRRGIRLQAP